MSQLFNLNGKWITAEEMQKHTLERQGETSLFEQEPSQEPTTEQKPSRQAIIGQLQALGIAFKGNMKTSELLDILNKNK